MDGLRERQKLARDKSIVAAAAALFRAEGYDGAKIEVIAAKANVSAGTIYNYYQNKGDLLVAIVAMEVDEVLKAGEKLIAATPKDAAKAVNKLFAIYLEHSLTYLSKEMWRHAMAISTQQAMSPFGRAYSALDQRLSQQVCHLIARLQAAGSIRADAKIDGVGELLFNNMNMMFIGFVKDETIPMKTLLRQIARQQRPLLAALAQPALLSRRGSTRKASAVTSAVKVKPRE